MPQNRALEAVTLIIILVLAVTMIAFFIPAAFVQLSNSPPPVPGNLIVLPNVFLQYGGNNVVWPPGFYNSCQITTLLTTCLTAGAQAGSSSISGFIISAYTIIELLVVVTLIILLLMVGYYYYRRS